MGHWARCLTLVAGLWLSSMSADATAPALTAEGWQQDVALLAEAVEALHPGALRYQEPAALKASLATLAQAWQPGDDLDQAYLALSRWAATLRCGHTYPNFWNQSESVRAQLFDSAPVLPFTFVAEPESLVLDRLAPPPLRPGQVITAINGATVADILAELTPLVPSDGHNEAARLARLSVTGWGRYESFDLLFALRYGAERYRLTLANGGSLTVAATTRARRAAALGTPPAPWSLSWPEPKVAHLKLTTLASWTFDFDWQAWLAQAFAELEQRQATGLVLDLRGNEGGLDRVAAQLVRHLISAPVTIVPWQQRLVFDQVPEALLPHLQSWDDSWQSLGAETLADEEGEQDRPWRRFPGDNPRDQPLNLSPAENAFGGPVAVLMDGKNRSATLMLLEALAQLERGRTFGRPSGGNRRGINGGAILYLRLPHSGLELDLPLIGYFADEGMPDGPLMPAVPLPTPRPGKADGDMAAALTWLAESPPTP
ncbi:S41 family peptidase [Ferrimonas balearica]|uniref:S41 family peptidase n=1 Tax=Ferrimonas balearica TaxID=44012 RepID=UPI001C9980B5|nr:S41 family peptidase [Ferrimonas balearica]MBY5992775.1 S41 family peptidase [Ferrimonas balearica]